MTRVRFILQNHMTESVNQQIQVLLRPGTIPPEADFFAWQWLNPAPNGEQGFELTDRLQIQVAEEPPEGSRSRRLGARPGDGFAATSERGQGPTLEWQSRDQSDAATVENLTQEPVRAVWFSENRRIMEQRDVATGASAEFELVPNFLVFRVANSEPAAPVPPPGLATDYDYLFDPRTTDQVRVTWEGDPGDSKLVFHPPSLIAEKAPDSAAKTKPGGKQPDGKRESKKPGGKKPRRKEDGAEKTAAKKTATKPSGTKKSGTKKSGAKKTAAKKTAAGKPAAKKPDQKQPVEGAPSAAREQGAARDREGPPAATEGPGSEPPPIDARRDST